MPWKNGGGETTEIVTFPEGAGLEDFAARISMARVASSGPFSIFAGIDRTLSVLSGQGLGLDFGTRGTIALDVASAPYAFPADVAVAGLVSGDGITDLNVMTRRAAARHFVSRLALETPRTFAPLAPVTLLLVLGANLAVSAGAQSVALAAGDALVATGAGEIALTPQGHATVFVIDLWV